MNHVSEDECSRWEASLDAHAMAASCFVPLRGIPVGVVDAPTGSQVSCALILHQDDSLSLLVGADVVRIGGSAPASLLTALFGSHDSSSVPDDSSS